MFQEKNLSVFIVGPTYAGKTSFLISASCFLNFAEGKLGKLFFDEGRLPSVGMVFDSQSACETRASVDATIVSDEIRVKGANGSCTFVSISGYPQKGTTLFDEIINYLYGREKRSRKTSIVFFIDLSYDIKKTLYMIKEMFLPILLRVFEEERLKSKIVREGFYIIFNKGDLLLNELDIIEKYERTLLAALSLLLKVRGEELKEKYKKYVTCCAPKKLKRSAELLTMRKNVIRAFLDLCNGIFSIEESQSLRRLIDDWVYNSSGSY
ncbi:MAG: hypothetical protein B6U95_00330 [Thermofilum sp. ex4484_82]|nr:MAG: hypothetical protein B6U95_00330 [Thermofilum sp. ex4484_82]OYT40062.1 MAG: hypothetical protein B6U96_00335 [Archaeoglobales archaeon ex4484_92]